MRYYLQASVMTETLGWWVEPISMKDVWKFAGMRSGVLCVMISGQLLMLQLPADSWDSLPQARHYLVFDETEKVKIICDIVIFQVQHHITVLTLARELVPFFWMTYFATAGRRDLLTVPTMELAYITAYTVKMLVSDVNVSLYRGFPKPRPLH